MCPHISVIIPVYNSSRFLRQCLDTIINQTLRDIEIICVDDGSTDDSLSILQEYAEKDQRFQIIHEQNAGGGVARNTGIDFATGKYLSFLDSDDFFDKDMLNLAFEKGIKTDADIVIFEWSSYDDDKQKSSKIIRGFNYGYLPSKDPFSGMDLKEHVFDFIWPTVWNKLYKRDFILKHNIRFQELRNNNDVSFSYRAIYFAEKISTINVNHALLSYRVNIGSSTQNKYYKNPTDVYRAFADVRNAISSTPGWNVLKDRFNDLIYVRLSNDLQRLKTDYSSQYYELLNIISKDSDFETEKIIEYKHHTKPLSNCSEYLWYIIKLVKYQGYKQGVSRVLCYVYVTLSLLLRRSSKEAYYYC